LVRLRRFRLVLLRIRSDWLAYGIEVASSARRFAETPDKRTLSAEG
jgi:hypothetical protein